MRHKNRYIRPFHTFLIVISCSHFAYSQHFNTFHTYNTPFVISTYKDYKRSITYNIKKRLVPLKNYITPLISDYKYATTDNFTHQVLYKNPVAYVRYPVAIALKKVQEELALQGLGLKFFDAYRPYFVTEQMWKIVPDERYAANPAKGSGHNRGTSVDVTLVKLSTKEELAMPTGFDDFSEKAHHDYNNLDPLIIENRRLLKKVMEKHGFVALSTEWWHYSLTPGTEKYELLNLDFSELNKYIK